MKKRLLFVDDDTNILDGLRRVFRNQRDVWEMHFASSGAEALKIMETHPIDIIIADINMPAMNGIQLLANVMDRYPGTIRMFLSGRSDSDLILKSVGVAHQYLSKPCNTDILKSVIVQAEKSTTFLQNNNLKGLVSKLGALPSVPLLFREISKELQSADASIDRIGDIISRDPSMKAKILQLANSAFFGRRRSMSKIAEAVLYLGLNHVAQLILAMCAFAEFRLAESSLFSIEALWTHSNSTALRAKRIAEEHDESWETVDYAFTAGLLHDIGKLVLASRLPGQYEKAVSTAHKRRIPLWLAEQEAFSATHAEVGGYLLGIWGLPNPIVDATAFHHNPMATPTEGFSALAAVHAADTFEYLADSGSVH